jgi:hypothetical protein
VIVESKHTSCYGCKLNKNNYCYWFNRPKIIPRDVINKGCKHREAKVNNINTTKIVGYIIDVFNGEIIQ